MLPAMPSEERASRLETYYDLSQSTAKLNVDIHQLALGQAQGSKNFSPGRVVLLYDQHFSAYTPAVIVRQVSAHEFLILAATTQDRKSGKLGRWQGRADIGIHKLLDVLTIKNAMCTTS